MAKSKKKEEEVLNPVGEVNIEVQNWYSFDWDKVKTLEDVKEILSALGMTVSDKVPGYQKLKKFLKEEVEYTTT